MRFVRRSAVPAVLALALYAAPAHAVDGGRVAAPGPDADINPERFGPAPPDPAYGAFQRGLYLTAFDLALPLAEKGDPAAETLVAEIYARGLGVPRDPRKAAEWYGKAAAQDVPEAEMQYALVLIDGKYARKDEKRAFDLMKKAADSGSRDAQFNLAQMIVEQEPGPSGLDKAYVYYEKAAAQGLADAQYAMSQAYANGVGGKPRDLVEARKWLLLAARQNYDTAELDLGTWMVEGKGGPVDFHGGFEWLKKAAEGGNVAAENRLAKLYRGGVGVKADKIEAAAWYVLARRAGLSDPEMDVFYSGLNEDDQKKAIERANALR